MYPSPGGQFDHLLHEVKPLLRPELVQHAAGRRQTGGLRHRPAGPEPPGAKVQRPPHPFGKLRLLYAAKFAPVRKVRALVIGIAQPYQLKKLNYAMVLRIYINA